jgi:hypothetical protein
MSERKTVDIKSEHEKSGKSYPRPRDKCDDCQGEIVLKWGPKRQPHWAHINKGECKSSSFGESATHKLAKKKIIEFLQGGGILYAKRSCNKCKQVKQVEEIKTQTASTFKEEFKDTSCIWDVAAINSKDEIIYGIEVLKTHKTTNLSPRENVPWFEFLADDILRELDVDVDKFPTSLTLDDKRDFPKCESKSCSLNDEKFPTSLMQCLRHNNNTDIKKLSLECKSKLYSHLSLNDIARELGYLFIRRSYSCKARELMDDAMHGKHRVSKDEWNTCGNSGGNSGLWKEFTDRKCCMRCNRCWTTKYKRPFCGDCWKFIRRKEEDGQEEEYEEISEERKNYLRNQIGWLNNVPGGWGNGSPCHFCKRNYLDTEENEKFRKFWEPEGDSVDGYVWFFGDKKCCCTVCLNDNPLIKKIILSDTFF